jgi:hypothetical protein
LVHGGGKVGVVPSERNRNRSGGILFESGGAGVDSVAGIWRGSKARGSIFLFAESYYWLNFFYSPPRMG